jgi:hypothetical protein
MRGFRCARDAHAVDGSAQVLVGLLEGAAWHVM